LDTLKMQNLKKKRWGNRKGDFLGHLTTAEREHQRHTFRNPKTIKPGVQTKGTSKKKKGKTLREGNILGKKDERGKLTTEKSKTSPRAQPTDMKKGRKETCKQST